ncbi:MAG: Lrp/AsnC family transcriptional regulator [Candidatus Methanomethylicia archaeon]
MFDWRESQTFRKYAKALDRTCQKIIETLHETKTNNLSLLAKKANMSPALVHYYYDKLKNKNILKLKVKINERNIGLQPIELIFKDENEKSETNLEARLKSIGYWRYIEKYYVQMDTYWHTYYNIPKEATNEFNRFVKSLEEVNIKTVYVNTNPMEINIKTNIDWFNEEEKIWNFQWDKWINDVLIGKEIDVSLEKAEEYVLLDVHDVFILKKLEDDAEISFKDIASEIKVTPPTVRYHYYKHLVKYGVIEGYEPILTFYPQEISINIMTYMRFINKKAMTNLLASLEGKPFARKALVNTAQNIAIIYNYLPLDQIVEFNKALVKIGKMGIVTECIMGIVDKKMENKIPIQLYEKGSWKAFS